MTLCIIGPAVTPYLIINATSYQRLASFTCKIDTRIQHFPLAVALPTPNIPLSNWHWQRCQGRGQRLCWKVGFLLKATKPCWIVCKYEGEGCSRTWQVLKWYQWKPLTTPHDDLAPFSFSRLMLYITNIENGPHKEGTIGNWSRALGSNGKMRELDAVFGSWNPHPGRRCMYTIHMISLC